MVNHVMPSSLKEALSCIQDGTYTLFAGGSDLMVQHRSPAQIPPYFDKNICYIAQLSELKYIKRDDDQIRIGAMTTLEEMLDSPLVPKLFKDVIKDIASPGIRYVATLGGNICNASPAGDTLVYLYAVDAKVCFESLNEKKILPIQDVIIGPRHTILKQSEMVTEIIIPQRHDQYQTWMKVGPRKADAISKVSCVGLAEIKDDIIVDFRIAWGAVYKTVLRKPEIEAHLIGINIKDIGMHIDDMLNRYDPWIQPIDDQRSTKIYRKKVAMNILQEFIETIGRR